MQYYNPVESFQILNMKLRRPKVTSNITSSGKVTVTGSTRWVGPRIGTIALQFAVFVLLKYILKIYISSWVQDGHEFLLWLCAPLHHQDHEDASALLSLKWLHFQHWSDWWWPFLIFLGKCLLPLKWLSFWHWSDRWWPFLIFLGKVIQHFSLSLLVSTGQLTVWVRWEGFLPAGGVSSSWTLQILWDTCKVCSFCHDCLALQFDLLCHSSTTTRTTFSYISEKLWVRFLPEIFTLMVALMVWHILHIYDIYVSQFGLAVRR